MILHLPLARPAIPYCDRTVDPLVDAALANVMQMLNPRAHAALGACRLMDHLAACDVLAVDLHSIDAVKLKLRVEVARAPQVEASRGMTNAPGAGRKTRCPEELVPAAARRPWRRTGYAPPNGVGSVASSPSCALYHRGAMVASSRWSPLDRAPRTSAIGELDLPTELAASVLRRRIRRGM